MEKFRFNKPGYGTPIIETINGTKQLSFGMVKQLMVDPDTGQLYWSVKFKPEYGMAIELPGYGRTLSL